MISATYLTSATSTKPSISWIRGRWLLDLTVILWMCNPAVKSASNFVLAPYGLSQYNMVAAGIVTYLPLLYFFISGYKVRIRYFIWIYLIVAVFFQVTLFFNPTYAQWYSRDIFGISYTVFRPDHGALWAVLMVELSENGQRLWNNIKVVAIVMFFYNSYLAYGAIKRGYWTYVSESGIVDQRNYDLDFGYNMMFVSIVFASWAFFDRKWWALIPSSIALAMVFWQGSRGAFTVLVFFCILVAFIPRGKPGPYVFRLFIVSTLGIWLLNSWQIILESGAKFARDKLGFESRTIEAVLEGQLLDDNGRDGIYALIRDALRVNPHGYGAFGDRPFIGPHYFWGYSHNIYFEMAMNFGVIPTVLILSVLLILVIRRLLLVRDVYFRRTFLIVVAMCMRLLVSDTFWGNNFFWITIGMILMYRPSQVSSPARGIGESDPVQSPLSA